MKFVIVPGHEPIAGLAGMSAGPKNKYLRQNRLKILDYLDDHGEAATRSHFLITNQICWDNFMSLGRRGRPVKNLTKQDRYNIRIEMLEETNRELKRDIRELREQYNLAIPLLAEKLKELLFQRVIESILESNNNSRKRLE